MVLLHMIQVLDWLFDRKERMVVWYSVRSM